MGARNAALISGGGFSEFSKRWKRPSFCGWIEMTTTTTTTQLQAFKFANFKFSTSSVRIQVLSNMIDDL